MHQQEVLEKNFKNQLREESKKRKSIVEELRKAERKIDDLGKLITVMLTKHFGFYLQSRETEKHRQSFDFRRKTS